MKPLSLFLVPLLLAGVSVVSAADTGFLERFAFADDRAAVLRELIPGTDDFYYFHALHLQHEGKRAELMTLLKEWEDRFQGGNGRRDEIRNRQALLDYGTDPAASLAYLRGKLGVSFNHQRITPDARPELPTRLDPSLVSRAAFQADALANTDALGNFTPHGLVTLLREGGTELTTARRRDLLSRIHRPDFAGLPGIIHEDLGTKESGGFGEFPIHGKLTLAQLEELLRLRPALLQNTNFVNAWAVRLRPAFGEDAVRSAEVREAWLDRLEAFTAKLAPSFNSLKAHVLYHRLIHDQQQGKVSEARLMAYLQLPRPVGYVRPEFRDSEAFRQPVDLNADFGSLTACPPVNNDEMLVRSLLLGVLAKADSAEKWAPYVESGWLAALHAEAKLLSGAPDAARWVSLLNPQAYQALKDRVDLDFDPAARRSWGAADEVAIDVHLKNVPKLLVKVYEINTENVHRTTAAQVNTDLNLDGLTANSEQTHESVDAPILRTRRTFQFPELKGKRGVWIIEFIGGGRSSRALVRKGGIRHVVVPDAIGTQLRLFHENMEPVTKGYVLAGPRRFDADEDGSIHIPFSERPGEQDLILGDGTGFTSLEKVVLGGESYELKAGFHVPRESLLPGKMAELAFRPALRNNGRPVPLDALSKVRLTIVSRTLDGLPATSVHDIGLRDAAGNPVGPQLADDAETIIGFSVPDRLASLEFSLEGEMKALATGQPVKLTASGSLAVNGISLTEQTSDLHLSRTESGYVLEERGRSGEERAEREVNVTLTHRDFTVSRTLTLKTDAAGAVSLGSLDGITSVVARSAAGVERRFALSGDRATVPALVQAKVGETVRLAWSGPANPQPGDVSVLELRNGVPVRDAAATVTVSGGMVAIRDLPQGEYAVEFTPSMATTVLRLAAGETITGNVVSPALTMELSAPAPLSIAGMAAAQLPGNDGKEGRRVLVFQIGNPGEETRVHVLASRFLPHFDAFESLGRDHLPQPAAWTNAWRPSLFQNARTIGEEYRYVLDRRGAKRFAGNLLGRPGLLLNPWSIADTVTAKQQAAAGEDAKAMDAERPASAAAPAPTTAEAKKDASAPVPMEADLSFLGLPGTVSFNLRPDKDGRVAIDAALLADRQMVRVVAVGSDSAAVRDFVLPSQPLALRDIRLTDALDPKQHYSRQNRVSLLEKDVPFEFRDALTATWQNIGNLGAAHGLLFSLTANGQLAEFAWLIEWPTLSAARKSELYSRYACHELHFFLARRDPEFFARVIAPYLVSKRDKTFMDHYLLGSDLSGYLRPWQYSGLNTAERVLLASRIEAERAVVQRMIRDWLDTQPRNPQRDAFLFETALNGRALGGQNGVALRGGLLELNDASDRGGFGFGGGDGNRDEKRNLYFKRAEMDQLSVDQPVNEPGAPAGAAGLAAGKPVDAVMALGALRQRGSVAAEESEQLLKEVAAASDGEELRRLEEGRDKVAEDFVGRKAGRGLNREKAKEVLSRRSNAAAKAERFFRQTEQTKEWAENNYYHLLIAQQNAGLVPPNRFWADYAAWDGKQPFVSAHLADAAGSFSEMILALAVLDLPFPSEAKPGKIERKENAVTLTSAGKGILFHQEIRTAEADNDGAKLLVSQNFYRHGDRFIEQAGEKLDKFVTGEFLTGVVYGCQVVVTNPSSSVQKLDLLFQIPKGAVPVLQTQMTRSVPIVLEPYHTGTFDFHFYFPVPGKFPHYPVHLSRNFRTAASAEPFTFNAVDRLTTADKASWEYVSQNAEPAEVLAFLREHNLNTLNLDLMLWRMQNVDFARDALALLRSRHVWHAGAASYALLHNLPEGVSDYLMHLDGFLAECGPVLDSPAVRIDPVERRTYQHLEYSPLINARAHTLGASRVILNDKLRAQFDAFCRVLSCRPALGDEDHLAAAYYLALQDRTEEAIARFSRVDQSKVAEELQYNYLKAWLALLQEDTATARTIATAHANHPVDRWRTKFTELASQLDEIEGRQPAAPRDDDRDASQDRLAAKEPALALQLENRAVTLNTRNLTEVTVNYYPMDLEFLFSANPFVTQDTSRFRMIRPNRSDRVAIPAGGQHAFALPEEFRSANVLVEVSGGGITRSEAAYANELEVQLSEGFGRLEVRHAGDRKPLAKVYVKVFAEVNGVPVFYKDGYTDLRGKFDYASLSTGDLDGASRFSILILSDQHGATVREAQPPAR